MILKYHFTNTVINRDNDTVINRVNHAKYLGLILDESLSWKEHIEALIKQLSKLASSYKIVRHRVKRDNKFNIYFAYTYSRILYGIEVYRTASSELLNKLQIQQNRSLKILFNKHYRMHTSDLYRELNLLNVPLIQNVQIASIVFKHKLNSLPPVFKNDFTCSNEIHSCHKEHN